MNSSTCLHKGLTLLVLGLGFVTSQRPSAFASDLPLTLPSIRVPAPSSTLAALRNKAIKTGYGSAWRAVGDRAAAECQYTIAAEAYRKEAAVYRRRGDVNGARAQEMRAARFTVNLQGFLRDEATDADRKRLNTGMRSEPDLGCYLGAFIDRDDALTRRFNDENWQSHAWPDDFEKLIGRRHASFFMYMMYGRPFPSRWADELKKRGQVPHIAWEPKSLSDVRNDAYIQEFARACARFDAPVFLRFAGEMNGSWTRYGGNPEAYKKAFRLVASVIHKTAPKAVMLWCPNAVPADRIAAYYPGDDAVDWVGVNFYSVLFYDNNPKRPATDDPTDLLQTVYTLYASRKPVAIGEWAATHVSAVNLKPDPDFAARKIARLYSALPRVYPRVKMVNWFDCNNLKNARPGRQLNNYRLTADQRVTRAYTDATAHPWFLGRSGDASVTVCRALSNGMIVHGQVPLSVWAKGPSDTLRVYWTVDGRVRHATARPGAAEWVWNTVDDKPGTHTVGVYLFDGQGRFLASRSYNISVQH